MPEQAKPKPLPDYERPPVVESILGVQFDVLPSFTNLHLGAFWKTLDAAEWPSVVEAPSLAPQFERFGESIRWANILQLQVGTSFPVRMQAKKRTNDRMIQVQNGRLHFNWLGETSNPYPRYDEVRKGFLEVLDRFLTFVRSEKLGEFKPNQWEVTYLNHIRKGTVWNTPNDWGFFRPLNAPSMIEGLAQAESFQGEWHFVLPEQRGRLHVGWQLGQTIERNEQPLIVLTLTARGPLNPAKANIEGVLDGLGYGREIIVRSFSELMLKEANDYWGLKNA